MSGIRPPKVRMMATLGIQAASLVVMAFAAMVKCCLCLKSKGLCLCSPKQLVSFVPVSVEVIEARGAAGMDTVMFKSLFLLSNNSSLLSQDCDLWLLFYTQDPQYLAC